MREANLMSSYYSRKLPQLLVNFTGDVQTPESNKPYWTMSNPRCSNGDVANCG